MELFRAIQRGLPRSHYVDIYNGLVGGAGYKFKRGSVWENMPDDEVRGFAALLNEYTQPMGQKRTTMSMRRALDRSHEYPSGRQAEAVLAGKLLRLYDVEDPRRRTLTSWMQRHEIPYSQTPGKVTISGQPYRNPPARYRNDQMIAKLVSAGIGPDGERDKNK